MKPQGLIMLAIAVSCGLVSMFGVKEFLKKQGDSKEESVRILAARTEIDAGQPLDEQNTYLVSVPVSLVPEDALRGLDEVNDRALRIPATTGEWLRANRLGEKGQFGAVARIPNGMAAVTIPVDATTTHSGMLEPGNRIDLMLTYDDIDDPRKKQTIPVLLFAEVFAIDSTTFGKDAGHRTTPKNITLVVTPEQARAVTHARNMGGKLSTVMRKAGEGNEGDRVTVISDEYLQSGFMKSNLDAPSVARSAEDIDDTLGPDDPRPARFRRGEKEPEMTPEMLQAEAELEAEENALNAAQAAEAEAAAEEPARPEKPLWTMEIYEGDNVVIEQVPLDADLSK